MLEYDINDPSHAVSGEYWQLGHALTSADSQQWRATAQCIHQGLPAKETKAFCQTAPVEAPQYWGCIRQPGAFWIYRFYLTGRDACSRPGRYFFILLKLDSPSVLRQPEALRLLSYLEKQRSIPIQLESTTSAPQVPSASLTEQLFNAPPLTSPEISQVITSSEKALVGSHYGWVVEKDGISKELSDLPFPHISCISPLPLPVEPKPVRVPPVMLPVRAESPSDIFKSREPDSGNGLRPGLRPLFAPPRLPYARIIHTVGLIVLGVVLGLFIFGSLGTSSRDLKRENRALKSENRILQDEKQELGKKHSELLGKYQDLDEKHSALLGKYQELSKENSELKRKCSPQEGPGSMLKHGLEYITKKLKPDPRKAIREPQPPAQTPTPQEADTSGRQE